MKLNLGIIGFGKSTTRYNLPYILNRKDKLVVNTIYNRKRKLELEENYKDENINFTDNLDELLNNEEIKFVVICTPPDTHYDFAKTCLMHGKNVLVEKPFTNSYKKSEELFNLAKEKGLIISAYQNRRFDSDFLAAKAVIKSGKLGKIVEVESHMDYFKPEGEKYVGKPEDSMIYGIGVHTIDQMISVFGKPEKVYFDVKSMRVKENPSDYYEVHLFYNDLKVKIETSQVVKSQYPRFIIHGTKGSFIKYGIDRQEICLKAGVMPWDNNFGEDREEDYGTLEYIDDNGNEIKEKLKTPVGDYGRVYDSLYDAIINKGEKFVKDEETLIVQKILEDGVYGENPKIVNM